MPFNTITRFRLIPSPLPPIPWPIQAHPHPYSSSSIHINVAFASSLIVHTHTIQNGMIGDNYGYIVERIIEFSNIYRWLDLDSNLSAQRGPGLYLQYSHDTIDVLDATAEPQKWNEMRNRMRCYGWAFNNKGRGICLILQSSGAFRIKRQNNGEMRTVSPLPVVSIKSTLI